MYKNHKIIALCISRMNSEHTISFVNTLHSVLEANGYKLLIFHTCTDLYMESLQDHGEESVFNLIPYEIVDAVLVYDEAFFNKALILDIIRRAKAHEKPVISVGAKYEGCHNILFPYVNGFEQVLRHLVEHHKINDIVMVAGTEGNSYSDERIAVFERILKENHIPFSEDNIYYGDYWYKPTERVAQRLIDSGHMPQAIMCINDFTAITISSYYKKKGIRVPEDVIIAGFDGTKQAEYSVPSITTSYCSNESISERVLGYLNHLCNNGPMPSDSNIDFTLKLGASCGCGQNANLEDAGTLLKVSEETLSGMREVNRSLYELSERLILSENPVKLIKGLDNLSIYNTRILINKSWFNPAINPTAPRKGFAFDDEMFLVYKNLTPNPKLDITCSYKELAPDFDEIIEEPNPILFNTLCYLGNIIGYIVMNGAPIMLNYSHLAQYITSIDRLFGDYKNIQYLKRIAISMEELSNRDSMTGMYNRKGFFQYLPAFIEKASKEHKKLLVASVDLDGLKHINDTYGHDAGDAAIIAISNAIQTLPLESTLCGRFGGDEFVVCMSVDSQHEDGNMLKSIDVALEKYNSLSLREFTVSASVGFVIKDTDNLDIEAAVRESDEKMYAIKSTRPNRR